VRRRVTITFAVPGQRACAAYTVQRRHWPIYFVARQ
jgi:hypothetical protein